MSGRDRDRPPPHDRAGEPGYVPRRARLRSADESAFGSDLSSRWQEIGRNAISSLCSKVNSTRGTADLADEEDPAFRQPT